MKKKIIISAAVIAVMLLIVGKLVINKANEKFGIKLKDLKSIFEKNISQIIVEDVKCAVTALNRGTPFVDEFRSAKISRCIYRLVDQLKK